MRIIEKYGLLIIKEGEFLINREFGTKFFLMPGGRPKGDEDFRDCLKREIMEELGCEIIDGTLNFFATFEDVAINDRDALVRISLYLGEIKGEPQVNSEIEEIKWFGKGDDTRLLSPIIKNKILPEVLKRNLI